MKKKRVKGFTLVEMIIVLALFSLIMYSVVELLGPVTKFFVRSSNFQDTTACIDNMRRSIEGNLKYADRVRVYWGYEPYTYENSNLDGATIKTIKTTGGGEYELTSEFLGHVKDFYDEFFDNRQFLDAAGKIYVLYFDNQQLISDTQLAQLDTLSVFNEKKLNAGQIVLFTFDFDNYLSDGVTYDENYSADSFVTQSGCRIDAWYVNQKMYGNYEYHFQLGSDETDSVTTTTGAGGAGGGSGTVDFSPSDFIISLTMTEISKSQELGHLVRTVQSEKSTVSFSMKNVLDGTVRYEQPASDFKIVGNPGAGGTNKYVQDGSVIERYKSVFRNPAISTDPSTDEFQNAGFYFIFTLPETTENRVDSQYISDVKDELTGAAT